MPHGGQPSYRGGHESAGILSSTTSVSQCTRVQGSCHWPCSPSRGPQGVKAAEHRVNAGSPSAGPMLDVRPYVFVSPAYATQLPASTSESVVKYRSPCPGADLRASSRQHGNPPRGGHDSAVPTASFTAPAVAVDAVSAAGRHAGVEAEASKAVGSDKTPPCQHERGAALVSGVASAAPEHLRRPHAPLRCRPDDAAVLHLLLPSALVPVDLSLHSSLCNLAAGKSRTALALSAVGNKDTDTSLLGCFSHPLACAASAEPASVAPSAARVCAGDCSATTAVRTASHEHAVAHVCPPARWLAGSIAKDRLPKCRSSWWGISKQREAAGGAGRVGGRRRRGLAAAGAGCAAPVATGAVRGCLDDGNSLVIAAPPGTPAPARLSDAALHSRTVYTTTSTRTFAVRPVAVAPGCSSGLLRCLISVWV